MQRDDRRVFGFAAVVCITCSLLLSGTAAALRSRQEYNIELDRKTNVLKAFGVRTTNEAGRRALTGDEVDRYFAETISEVVIDAATGEVLEGLTSAMLTRDEIAEKTRLPLYLWREDGAVRKYAFPISGKGLWSTIYGYLALDRDLATIIGITFYRHGETPGLGGEIEQAWFQDNFTGKRLWEDGEVLPFEVVKGRVEDRYPDGNPHAVDGITGATLTGQGVQNLLREDMAAYEIYFRTLRGS